VIPAKNEGLAIGAVVEGVLRVLPDSEVIVVDDGSEDETASLAENAGASVIRHPYSKGNGAAIKAGARLAKGEVLVFMDGDGQHSAEDLKRLLARLDEGYDMVVGARQKGSQANVGRSIANSLYNAMASYMTGQSVKDLTSGFRAVRADKFRQFLYLLPNGFSYPTTSTMAFFRAGYSVAYEPIHAEKRQGKSHIRVVQDGLRFLLIIFKVGTLYSPLKLFFPIAFIHALIGLLYYAYTFYLDERLSIATIFMLTAATTIFLIGLVSEQITALIYKNDE
jgi:glycosyltransferase involved in cell wall biosynthesis